MIFRQLFDSDSSTYSYLLADRESREAVLIDSVDCQIERDLKLIDELGLRLIYALETHLHADHITASGELRQRTGCRIGIGKHAGVATADLALEEGDRIEFGRHVLSVLETPGHTDGCLTYRCEDMLFTGDALLIRACGRTDFQQGSADTLHSSVTGKLFSLPAACFVYPCHDYHGMTRSTIDEEKRFNPRLTQSREAFIETMNNLNLSKPKRIDEAVPANLRSGIS